MLDVLVYCIEEYLIPQHDNTCAPRQDQDQHGYPLSSENVKCLKEALGLEHMGKTLIKLDRF